MKNIRQNLFFCIYLQRTWRATCGTGLLSVYEPAVASYCGGGHVSFPPSASL